MYDTATSGWRAGHQQSAGGTQDQQHVAPHNKTSGGGVCFSGMDAYVGDLDKLHAHILTPGYSLSRNT